MSHISNVFAREVLDSRGKPTVEVEVTCKNGVRGRAIVPSGASTGQAEALELRDKDCVRYDGQGVQRAVANVNQKLGPAVMGMDAVDQQAIDAILLQQDATPQKSAAGGNALLGVSLATARGCRVAASPVVSSHQPSGPVFLFEHRSRAPATGNAAAHDQHDFRRSPCGWKPRLSGRFNHTGERA